MTVLRSYFQLAARYAARHWRGELPLTIAFWINGIVFLSPLSLALAFAQAARNTGTVFSPIGEFLFIVVPMLFDFVVAPWAIVGIWRSAGVSIAEGGRLPGYSVRGVMLVRGGLYAMLVAVLASAAFPQFRLGSAAADVLIHGYTMLSRRGVVSLGGQITPRTVAELKDLAETQKIRVFAMSEAGGSLDAAFDLAAIVKEHRIDVMASGNCNAMCAIVLAAAPRRIVREGIRIQPIPQDGTGASRDRMVRYYADAGMVGVTVATTSLATLVTAGLVTNVLDLRRKLHTGVDWCAAHETACAAP